MFPPDQDSNLPSNATVRSLFDDITFKMNREFVIALSGPVGFAKPIPLMVGMNEIKIENTSYMFEVMEVPTVPDGFCYIIIPDQVFMRPYQDMLALSIARNITKENEDMRKLLIQISSKETFNTLSTKMSGMKNFFIEEDFIANDTILQMVSTEENIELIKDCSETPFFKCFALKFAETQEYNCTKKCVPILYDSLMRMIENNIPTCSNDVEEYCMSGLESSQTSLQLFASCPKQCKIRRSVIDRAKIKQKPLHQMGKVQLDIYFQVTPDRIFNREYLIYDGLGMFGSIGGSLGLFIGFSIYDTLCFIVDFVQKKFNLF